MSNPLRKVKLNKIFIFIMFIFKFNLKKVFYNFVLFVLCLTVVFKQLGFNFILRPSFFGGGI